MDLLPLSQCGSTRNRYNRSIDLSVVGMLSNLANKPVACLPRDWDGVIGLKFVMPVCFLSHVCFAYFRFI